MRYRLSIAIPAILAGAVYATASFAQDAAFDPKALDATVSSSKPKGKKPRAEAAPAQKPGKMQDRQFGELEGWSPGKNPPKKDEDARTPSSAPGKGAPVSVSPSGNMSVGLPF